VEGEIKNVGKQKEAEKNQKAAIVLLIKGN
jgi:hypothetical protein